MAQATLTIRLRPVGHVDSDGMRALAVNLYWTNFTKRAFARMWRDTFQYMNLELTHESLRSITKVKSDGTLTMNLVCQERHAINDKRFGKAPDVLTELVYVQRNSEGSGDSAVLDFIPLSLKMRRGNTTTNANQRPRACTIM